MHPIERLRWVARAGGADHGALAGEAARALAGFANDPIALVTACRRIIDQRPTSGPMWWLAASVLSSNDPRAAAVRCVTALGDDPTAAALAYELPDDATVAVVGWPEHVGEAVVRRGDLHVLVVDSLGEGTGLVRRLAMADTPADEVTPSHLAAAVSAADLVVLEASAFGPDGFLGITGSLALAAVAREVGTEVWLTAGVGRGLSEPLWAAMSERLRVANADAPWEADEEIVPLTLVDRVVGPKGLVAVATAVGGIDTPAPPELRA